MQASDPHRRAGCWSGQQLSHLPRGLPPGLPLLLPSPLSLLPLPLALHLVLRLVLALALVSVAQLEVAQLEVVLEVELLPLLGWSALTHTRTPQVCIALVLSRMRRSQHLQQAQAQEQERLKQEVEDQADNRLVPVECTIPPLYRHHSSRMDINRLHQPHQRHLSTSPLSRLLLPLTTTITITALTQPILCTLTPTYRPIRPPPGLPPARRAPQCAE